MIMKASIDSIETCGLVDGPGIRVVVFFNGCKLRCKYCHNPEMWIKKENNYTPEELVSQIKRYQPYFKNNGGVTLSGGEPLLHSEFIIQLSTLLKKENIHLALDTAGIGNGNYEKLLENIDLILLDIKACTQDLYQDITGGNMLEVEKFIKAINKLNKKVWIRQVIIPNVNDTCKYMVLLAQYLKKINNVERVDFLPFHRLGKEKYDKLKLIYPYSIKNDMDKDKTAKLYQYFKKIYIK